MAECEVCTMDTGAPILNVQGIMHWHIHRECAPEVAEWETEYLEVEQNA